MYLSHVRGTPPVVYNAYGRVKIQWLERVWLANYYSIVKYATAQPTRGSLTPTRQWGVFTNGEKPIALGCLLQQYKGSGKLVRIKIAPSRGNVQYKRVKTIKLGIKQTNSIVQVVSHERGATRGCTACLALGLGTRTTMRSRETWLPRGATLPCPVCGRDPPTGTGEGALHLARRDVASIDFARCRDCPRH